MSSLHQLQLTEHTFNAGSADWQGNGHGVQAGQQRELSGKAKTYCMEKAVDTRQRPLSCRQDVGSTLLPGRLCPGRNGRPTGPSQAAHASLAHSPCLTCEVPTAS